MFLALDTSTLTLTLALCERSSDAAPDAALRVIARDEQGPPKKQSELLPGAIEALLEGAGIKLPQLEGIVVGLGPGSFTGLRIGLATAKALSYAANVKLAGVSSLQAVGLVGPEGPPLFTVAVARVDELYLGVYRRQGRVVTALEPETALRPDELAAKLREVPDAVVLGPAVGDYRAKLEALGVEPARLLDVAPFPTAEAIAELARFPAAFDVQAMFALEPHYVRASEAERNPKFPPLPGPPPTSRIRED